MADMHAAVTAPHTVPHGTLRCAKSFSLESPARHQRLPTDHAQGSARSYTFTRHVNVTHVAATPLHDRGQYRCEVMVI